MLAQEWIVDQLVTQAGILHGARVAAVDGRIVAVDQLAAAPDAVRLRGTLLPGFVDLQVNGAGGRSVDEATSDALDTVAAAVAAGGAVAFLPTLITAPWDRLLDQVRRVGAWLRDYRGPGATPLGLHLEGPFLTTPGAHDRSCFVAPDPQRIDELLEAAAGSLRLVTLANAHPLAPQAVARLTAAGVACALGHCDSPTGFAECVAAGANSVTHLFNVMGAVHHRTVGLAGFALDDARVSCPLIVDGVHVHPAMIRNAFRILGPDRTVLVTDAVGAAGMPDGEYTLSGMKVHSKTGVVRDAAGNLAGSALTMSMAAANFLRFVPDAGVWTLARAAATNPARVVGADVYGSIAVGKRAAFTLLRPDGTCAFVS
ncbi:MAG: N-acetylglucosamine-6-phosphate deacetylase [Planctomycetota bacterium]